MGAQSGTVRRRIRLDGEALVEQPLVVNLLQKIPECLNVSVVVSDIRIVHVHPISDALCHVHPLAGVLHDLMTAGVIVLGYGNLLADVILVDAEFLLDADLHRESVGVPSCAAVHLISCLSLVSTNGILDRAGHYVMYARHTIS